MRTIKLREAREYHNRYRTTEETYYYFDSRFFEINGQKWEIVATQKGDSKHPHDVTHTVKKCDTPKKFYEYTMDELIKRYKKGVLK